MSGSALSQRLAAFRTNFKQILGPKRQGYGELAQLEQPLVGAQDSTAETGNDEYLRQHGVARPGAGGGAAGVASQGPVPSQVSDDPDAADVAPATRCMSRLHVGKVYAAIAHGHGTGHVL